MSKQDGGCWRTTYHNCTQHTYCLQTNNEKKKCKSVVFDNSKNPINNKI